MQINPSIFKSYDIRGIYPTDLNEEAIVAITKAIYTFFHKKKPTDMPLSIVVGTDMRVSSPSLTKRVIETLVELGANVIDIGIVSTPTFYFAVNHYSYECGMQITASHNPKEWNGIKFVKNTPQGLIKIGKTTGMPEIKEMATKGESIKSIQGGKVEKKEKILNDEVKNALRISKNPKINKFKIVADAANAMGSQYINEIFKVLPGELIRMNFDLDGTFPAHQPDPLQEKNLADLKRKVLAEKADLGLAPDGDGDRLFFIDERGETVPPTIITSIIATDLLKDHPGETVLVDVRYLLTPKKILEEIGGKIHVVKVGHAFITEAMYKTGGIFAGESSSHFFYRDTGNAESQMATIIAILKALTKSGKTMSQLVEEFRRSFESGEINFETENAAKIMDELKEKYADGSLDTMDGIAISYPSWRFSIRTSNTEPLLRLNVESLNKEEMEKKRDEILSLIQKNL
ncbi:MAG: phosphomannomutase/phosphoglucomutase [Candidatus Levybacteria bacterium CG_4_9_14_3_um_filter_35_16]|nr:MAG: phosphomannomutase/phosphoglucomutase [Candidatus Levybacteria bacterium CG22_combo_CG10-13_8_21_14_all_35_11]PJA91327.1 MAG: phosphomannomutase/phosphoglucomutase [Candidatus Levybacteria bacterium CG_4_9_14_3_um_filter_35_16]PJC54824.1 MAG: phosphomannomutase/phosphoglucomutase [Candidatus Levybacteria bacterium CG_4_9_14_0_2_um_filter_35_21]